MEGSYREARFGSRGLAEYARGDVDGHCATDEASATAIAAAQREARALSDEERSLVATAKRSALRFPDTQQQLANAHTALAAGVAGAIPLRLRCSLMLSTHTVRRSQFLSCLVGRWEFGGVFARQTGSFVFSQIGISAFNPVCSRGDVVAGPRWLTTKYRMGDVLILSIFTLHASTDNLSTEVRLR